jgi:hypothetical protein
VPLLIVELCQKEDYSTKIDSVSHGGLEFDLEYADFEKLPRVIKSPFFYKFADKVLNNPETPIEHVFIPVRKLEDAANSRVRVQKVYEGKMDSNLKSDEVPGGLTGKDAYRNQEVILDRQLTSLIESVAKSGKPHTFLAFPTFVRDPDYLYKAVKFLIPDTPFEFFSEIFERIVDLNKVHNFSEHKNDDYVVSKYDSLLNNISHEQYLFSVDDYIPSAWIGHTPVMKFIIRELKPKVFVELGVHNGFSYFVGCQAIRECQLSTKSFAIDHWLGDSQAGFFDDNVFPSVITLNQKYSEFSNLLKMKFDEALDQFENSSIELLHIDGFHSYESVKKDFIGWLPKMSSNAIILLHDIHVRRNTFGVYKFWGEIKDQFQTMEFTNSHGLGIIFLGEIPKGKLRDLFKYSEQGGLSQIQGTFGSISDDVIQSSALSERDSALSERDSALSERDSALSERDSALSERDSALSERDLILKSTIWKATKTYRKLKTFIVRT